MSTFISNCAYLGELSAKFVYKYFLKNRYKKHHDGLEPTIDVRKVVILPLHHQMEATVQPVENRSQRPHCGKPSYEQLLKLERSFHYHNPKTPICRGSSQPKELIVQEVLPRHLKMFQKKPNLVSV